MKQLTFIDLFAGIGGMRLGHEWASMKCVGFCEFDKFAVKSYRAIHDTEGEWYGEDITKVRGAEVPHADVWCFGFPCQDISVAGKKRGLDGERSGLFHEVMRLLGEKGDNKPEWLVVENVGNLLSINAGRGFVEVLNQMAAHGYDVRWEVLNSKDFGVPQNRKRAFIVGRARERSRGEVLPESKNGGSTVETCSGNAQGVQTEICTAVTTMCGRRPTDTFITRKVNQVGQLMFTLTAQDRYGVAIIDGVEVVIRRLTPRECWRLQGMDDERFNKAQAAGLSDTQLYKQAGNAVTATVAKAVGEAIMNEVNNEDY